MPPKSTRPAQEPEWAPEHFGDLLALARQAWVREMGSRLRARGYEDYRRSDAAVMRLLRGAPMPVGRIGERLAITRQAARKLAEALRERGYATIERDPRDARRLNVSLSPAGERYAAAVIDALVELNGELVANVAPEELTSARRVLLSAIAIEHRGRRAQQDAALASQEPDTALASQQPDTAAAPAPQAPGRW